MTEHDPPPQWWFLYTIIGLLVVFLALSERGAIAQFLHRLF